MSKLYTSVAILSAAPLLDVCASSVHIRALAPAAVPMPANLQSIATVNLLFQNRAVRNFTMYWKVPSPAKALAWTAPEPTSA